MRKVIASAVFLAADGNLTDQRRNEGLWIQGRKNRCMIRSGGQKSAQTCIASSPYFPEKGLYHRTSVPGALARSSHTCNCPAQLPGDRESGRSGWGRGHALGGLFPPFCCVRAPATDPRVRRQPGADVVGGGGGRTRCRLLKPVRAPAQRLNRRWRLQRRLQRLKWRGGRAGREGGWGGWTRRGGCSGRSRRLNSSDGAGGDAGCPSPPRR